MQRLTGVPGTASKHELCHSRSSRPLPASRGSTLPFLGSTTASELPDLARQLLIYAVGIFLYPSLSTLLAGPYGPTVWCAVLGRVAAPSPLNMNSY